MTFWVEHADTFSYEYTVVAECETREEAQEVRDWYQARTGAMSEYRVVDSSAKLRSTPIPQIIEMAKELRQRARPLRAADV